MRKPETLSEAMDGIEAETKIGPKTPITWQVLKAVISMVGRAGANTRKDVDARFRAMEKRMAEVETRGLEYKGIYSRAVTYRKGDLTTCNGALWIAADSTNSKPGEDSTWVLAAKSTR